MPIWGQLVASVLHPLLAVLGRCGGSAHAPSVWAAAQSSNIIDAAVLIFVTSLSGFPARGTVSSLKPARAAVRWPFFRASAGPSFKNGHRLRPILARLAHPCSAGAGSSRRRETDTPVRGRRGLQLRSPLVFAVFQTLAVVVPVEGVSRKNCPPNSRADLWVCSRTRQRTRTDATCGNKGVKSAHLNGCEQGRMARWRREWDSNPRYGFPYTRFPSERLQPLGHPSGNGAAPAI